MAKKNNKKVEKNSAEKANKKHWFREFRAELKKVTWPSKKELLENSVVVISMVIIVALVIFVLDLGFKSLTQVEIEQVEKIKNSVEVNSTENGTEGETSNSNDDEIILDTNNIQTDNQENVSETTANDTVTTTDSDGKTIISADSISAGE